MIEVIGLEKFKKFVYDYENSPEGAFLGERPLILNFFATWCGPCHMLAPLLEEAAEQHQAKIDIFKVDIDQSPELAALFGIRSVPTTLFIKPGEEPAMAGGAIGSESLERGIREILGVS